MLNPLTGETMLQIQILWGEKLPGSYETEPDTYTFRTQEELDGFRLGIAVACGWSDYKIVGEDD